MKVECVWPGQQVWPQSKYDSATHPVVQKMPEKPQGSLVTHDDFGTPQSDQPTESFQEEISTCSNLSINSSWLPPILPEVGGTLAREQECLIRMVYPSALTGSSAIVFDFLRARFLPQLIRPAASCRVIELFSEDSLAMAAQEPACMHALLACAGSELPAQTTSIQKLTQDHYTKAVVALRKSLSREMTNKWLVTMHTVLMLCIYEVSAWPGEILRAEMANN